MALFVHVASTDSASSVSEALLRRLVGGFGAVRSVAAVHRATAAGAAPPPQQTWVVRFEQPQTAQAVVDELGNTLEVKQTRLRLVVVVDGGDGGGGGSGGSSSSSAPDDAPAAAAAAAPAAAGTRLEQAREDDIKALYRQLLLEKLTDREPQYATQITNVLLKFEPSDLKVIVSTDELLSRLVTECKRRFRQQHIHTPGAKPLAQPSIHAPLAAALAPPAPDAGAGRGRGRGRATGAGRGMRPSGEHEAAAAAAAAGVVVGAGMLSAGADAAVAADMARQFANDLAADSHADAHANAPGQPAAVPDSALVADQAAALMSGAPTHDDQAGQQATAAATVADLEKLAPAEVVPAEIVPSEVVSTEAPAEAAATEAAPAETVPAEATPAETVPADAVPLEAEKIAPIETALAQAETLVDAPPAPADQGNDAAAVAVAVAVEVPQETVPENARAPSDVRAQLREIVSARVAGATTADAVYIQLAQLEDEELREVMQDNAALIEVIDTLALDLVAP